MSTMASHFIPLEDEIRRKGIGTNVNRLSATNFLEKAKSDEMWQKYSKALGFNPEVPCLSKYKKTYLGIEVTTK